MITWEVVVFGFPFIVLCAFLGPLLNWQHEQWLKSLKEKRDERNAQ